jgi:hypothetical protein
VGLTKRSPEAWLRGAAAALIALLSASGFASLDFGQHWDEGALLRQAYAAQQRGSLLPGGQYNYPSLSFDLALAATWGVTLAGVEPAARGADEALAEPEESPADLPRAWRSVLLTSRALCFAISMLGPFWLWWGLSPLGASTAIFAALFYATSWELSYHARWLAPDAMMAHFVCALIAFSTRYACAGWKRRDLLGAGAALGAAASAKYTAGLLLPLVLALAFVDARRQLRAGVALRGVLARAAQAPAVALAAFVAITPGALFETEALLGWIGKMGAHYGGLHETAFGATPYAVESGWPYLVKLARYVLVAMPSPFAAGSAVFCVCAIAGVIQLCRREQRSALALWLAPLLLYAVFFAAGFRVFIPRNFLQLFPFACCIAAAGAAALVRRGGWTARGALAVVALATVANAGFIARENLWLWQKRPLLDRLAAYLDAQPPESVQLSCMLRRALASHREVRGGAGFAPEAERFVFLLRELRRPGVKLRRWDAQSDQGLRAIGPAGANPNYYPTWPPPTLVSVPRDFAEASGLRRALCRAELRTNTTGTAPEQRSDAG